VTLTPRTPDASIRRVTRGEIVAIGSELLLGGRPDTNSLFLTDGLATAGVDVRFKSVVGDDVADLVAVLRTACRRADVVLMTGGLGPTRDDCTRRAVATLTGRALRRHPEAFEIMRKRLAVWGRTPTAAQRRQALIPAGAEVLDNPIGSAPGFCLTWKRCLLAALPGVPREAQQMFARSLAPKLRARVRGAAPTIGHRLIHTFGLPETEVEARLDGVIRAGPGLRLGFLSSPLGVTVSLTEVRANGAPPRLERSVRTVYRRLGPYVYGEEQETMEQIVGRQLAARRLTLAVAESCTGGLIGHRLTEVAGSSTYLDRVAVCYSNRAKERMLGVPARLIRRRGAVSAEVAAAMAAGIRARSGAAIGLSVTGIAGPGGATPDKPVGLVFVGLETPDLRRARVQEFRFHGDRQTIKLRASQAALNLLRQWLLSRPAALTKR
jgi:nicotinamide-nucleotide amidase